MQNLEAIVEDQKELMMILDDLIRLPIPNLPQTILNAFSNECLSPLLQSLCCQEPVFNLKVVLLIANMIVANIHNKEFIDAVVFALFGKYYSSTLCVKLMHPVERPLSYSKKWTFKGFWDSYQDNVVNYCTEAYFGNEKSIVGDILNQSTSKSAPVQKKYTSEMKSIFGMGTNFYEREVEKIEQVFAIPIHSEASTFKRKSTMRIIEP